ncbi:hypothetical protein [Amycolatopsis jejuensis]|uniref:hypothetical protein n=1 Tax=Amycolatopsis jejuensis TaxID=330084 RepID=UPI0012E05E35|nr:hypothetical protein [Amycolatopsis jejuensis]
MVRWRRNSEETAAPWEGAGLVARPEHIPVRRRTVPGVVLSAGEVRASMHARDLRDFGRGRVDVVESIGDGPLAFLSHVRAAAPSSLAAEQVRDLPADAVVLLVADPGTPPVVVLTGAVRDGFLEWTQQLTG